MRRGIKFWALWILALIGMTSGCSMSPRRRDCTVLGGMVGAIVGGGIGAGVGPIFRHSGTDRMMNVLQVSLLVLPLVLS